MIHGVFASMGLLPARFGSRGGKSAMGFGGAAGASGGGQSGAIGNMIGALQKQLNQNIESSFKTFA